MLCLLQNKIGKTGRTTSNSDFLKKIPSFSKTIVSIIQIYVEMISIFVIAGLQLFTEKEMRDITRKNYKKLPEVQQRLKSNREKILRNADKFIVNTFTKV